jgi:hypothetical protein
MSLKLCEDNQYRYGSVGFVLQYKPQMNPHQHAGSRSGLGAHFTRIGEIQVWVWPILMNHEEDVFMPGTSFSTRLLLSFAERPRYSGWLGGELLKLIRISVANLVPLPHHR